MRLGRLNERGIEMFSAFLDSLSEDTPNAVPRNLLVEDESAETVEPPVEIESRTFTNRLEIAAYLYQRLAVAGITTPENDPGLWAWLSLFYFEQLCPPGRNGRRKPGERARWIPVVGHFRYYYRHLLVGPYLVFRAHRDDPERALALLCGPPHEASDTYLELAKRQELITNPAVIGAATRLYYDPRKRRLKRAGARGAPGTVRRFVEVLMQLDVAWDLYSLSKEELIEMLPSEFDRFRR